MGQSSLRLLFISRSDPYLMSIIDIQGGPDHTDKHSVKHTDKHTDKHTVKLFIANNLKHQHNKKDIPFSEYFHCLHHQAHQYGGL